MKAFFEYLGFVCWCTLTGMVTLSVAFVVGSIFIHIVRLL